MLSTQIISLIDELNNNPNFSNLENLQTIYHYSIPNVKLSYPEPFIASASFMHNDLWFVHILTYQYWLWFIFIFIIIFFFLTFISTVRWCNMRIRPKRETRGVSRSKCGDLITACVPVSWATSIIVNESTDAIDYFDGFGTTELVIGIRAYQWGWEYYYPKDIDLNHNINKNYSTFLGNSLKYNKTTEINNTANNLWKFYQNKNSDSSITPAFLLLLPKNKHQSFYYLNFNQIGANTFNESNAFKKIKNNSKVYSSNLYFLPNNFLLKFKNFSKLYKPNSFNLDSSTFHIKRQTNFLSSQSLLNNKFNFIDKNSFTKLITFNFENSRAKQYFSVNTSQNKIDNSVNLFFLNFNYLNNKNFFNFLFYNNNLFSNNNFYSKKNIFTTNKIVNLATHDNFFPQNYFFSTKLTQELNLTLNNFSNHYNLFFLFSSQNLITLTERTIRNFLFPANKTPYSLTDYSFDYYKINLNNFKYLNYKNLNWTSNISMNNLITNQTNFDYPYSPIVSNHLFFKLFNYDLNHLHHSSDTSLIFQGKEETIPNYFFSAYWNFYFNKNLFQTKINNNLNYYSLLSLFYFPNFSIFYDYDFRNWQHLELLENFYWESYQNLYLFDEYFNFDSNNINNNINNKNFFFFNLFNRNFENNHLIVTKDYLNEYYPSFYIEDFFLSPLLILTKNFNLISSINDYLLIEENYDNFKNYLHFFLKFNNFFFTFFTNVFTSISYAINLDFFRSNFDEFSWFFSENLLINKNIFFPNANEKKFDTLLNEIENNFFIFANKTTNEFSRFSNSINLRNTTKNSIVTFNALQKVFKNRFDDGRSHANLENLNNTFPKIPFITENRTSFEKILGKNKENFYKINFFKYSFKNFINFFYNNNSIKNYHYFDFPFLLAFKSDSSRYIWFDWYAKWGFYEIQPSSSSRYAIYGMPYFSKIFDFGPQTNEQLFDTENYLTRLSKARKNYLPNWTYAPYFFNKNNYWFKFNIFTYLSSSINYPINSLSYTKSIINFFNKTFFFQNNLYTNFKFIPSNSNINSYSKISGNFLNNIQGYYYLSTTLIDILSKRELMLRDLILKTNKLINLPNFFKTNPQNPLLLEIKSNFLFIDFNKFKKNLFIENNNFFKFDFIKKIFLNNIINKTTSNSFFNSFFNYFFNYNYLQNNLNFLDTTLLKNQYRPLKKGISNMIRLHATGAMALPIELRLQILASSKDVIHSWAIPSAGIKIDCVPGYSSHRVMIFLVSGIFWGQCMEICGRYHHWMPIIVYFMKRDLFFLWCNHFIFLNSNNNQFLSNNKQFYNFNNPISFDKSVWISEMLIK